MPYRTNSLCQQQPAVLQLDGRATIANLNEFPRILGLKDGMTTVPCVKVVGMNQMEALVVLPTDHRIAAIDFPWEQSHALIACRRSAEWSHPERSEIRRFQQLRADRPAAIGCVGCVECSLCVVVEFNESSVLDAVCLGVRDRQDDAFAQFFVWLKGHFDIVAIGLCRPASDFWDRRETRGRIDGYASVSSYGAGPERQR